MSTKNGGITRPPEGGVWSCLKVLHSCPDGSHNALRQSAARSTKQAMGAKRQRLHSPAKRGNDQCAKRQEKLPSTSEPESPSVGRVEVLRRGTSRKDAARGVKGHGRPLYAGPRSGTGRREVWPQARPGCRGGLLFGYFLLVGAAIRRQEKVTRRKGERGGVPVVWKINLSPLLQVFLARRATEPAYLLAAQLPSSAQGVSYAARECDAVESVCEGWTGMVADGGGNSEPWSGYLL